MVFYAAIKAGLMDPDLLKPVYAHGRTADEGELLTTAFGTNLQTCAASGETPRSTQAGDIIASTDFEHVAAVIEPGKNFEDTKVSVLALYVRPLRD